MKLVIASNNSHKIHEIKQILSGKFDEILSLREAGVEHETVEDGKTFMENALKKAREIAEICGFCDVYYFSRVFKKETQMTPGQYRAKSRK